MSAHTPGPWRWNAHTKDHNGTVYAEPTRGHAYAVAVKPQYVSAEQWAKDAPILASALEVAADNARLRTVNEALVTVNEALVKALEFYAEAWDFTTNKRYGGLEYHPKETLLDDCGNIARAALSLAKGEG